MLSLNSMTVSGVCRIDEVDVAFLSASSSSGISGNYSSNKNIVNKAVYQENQEQCERDFVEFDRVAMELMSQIEET